MSQSPRSTLASRMAAEEPSMDEKSLNAVFNSLRDRVYQRSFNLRKTFRELDAAGNGAVPINEFANEMVRFFSLSPLETRCLHVLLEESDFRRDGKIDFREFCEMLKMRDYDSEAVVSDSQRKRLQGHGVMDPRMQRMMRDGSTAIRVQGGVPTNELGHMNIECPFGVLGDSERMDAVMAAFITHKTANLREVFAKHDDDHDGYLTRVQFRNAMKEVDRYVFDSEIDSLLDAILDNHQGHSARKQHGASATAAAHNAGSMAPPSRTGTSSSARGTDRHAGLVHIEKFVAGAGQEYLKKKAHRSNAHANPFVWKVPSAPPRTANGSSSSPRRPVHPNLIMQPAAASSGGAGVSLPSPPERAGSKRSSRRATETRSSELRALEMRARLVELRKDDPYFAMAMDERRGRNGGNNDSSTPRLPLIASGRGMRK